MLGDDVCNRMLLGTYIVKLVHHACKRVGQCEWETLRLEELYDSGVTGVMAWAVCICPANYVR